MGKKHTMMCTYWIQLSGYVHYKPLINKCVPPEATMINDICAFSIFLQCWKKLVASGRKPIARSSHTTCLISDTLTGEHPILMVIGGFDQVNVLADVWLLDVTSQSWREVLNT